jgi:integrase
VGPSGTKKVYRLASNGGTRFHYVVKLLNYAFFDKYHIQKLTDITQEIVCDFLNDYGLYRLPDDDETTQRCKQTVEVCVSDIIDFLKNVVASEKDLKLKESELYREVKTFSKQKRKYVTQRVPAFKVHCNAKPKTIFRDIPEVAFKVIFNQIIVQHKNILMLAALSAFAGLRPSESCNVRRADSALGPGIRFELCGEEVTNIFIDLSEEKNLRSDLVSVGGIKKERTQKIYPAFLQAFNECYKIYMQYIEGEKFETDYGALTNGQSGKAYTYQSYYTEFQKVIRECIPIMLSSNDPQLQIFGQLLLENRIGPHIFRHWFSVMLTLYGVSVAELMYWRGDANPESALTYLNNKSDLVRQYNKVVDRVFNYSLWRAQKLENG